MNRSVLADSDPPLTWLHELRLFDRGRLWYRHKYSFLVEAARGVVSNSILLFRRRQHGRFGQWYLCLYALRHCLLKGGAEHRRGLESLHQTFLDLLEHFVKLLLLLAQRPPP